MLESAIMEVILGAGGLVFNREGRVLIIRHRDSGWVFPKGHIDPGETALQTAIREVEEEAGINAVCADPKMSFTTGYRNARDEQRRIHWFILEGDGEPLMREELFPEGAFVKPDNALNMLAHEVDRSLLNEALEYRAERVKADEPGTDRSEVDRG